jgi:hypothetical protein
MQIPEVDSSFGYPVQQIRSLILKKGAEIFSETKSFISFYFIYFYYI